MFSSISFTVPDLTVPSPDLTRGGVDEEVKRMTGFTTLMAKPSTSDSGRHGSRPYVHTSRTLYCLKGVIKEGTEGRDHSACPSWGRRTPFG